jgi:D-alanine-D-alanine ligase
MSENVGLRPAEQPGRRPRVAVVFGGRSSEHAISCVTAAGVLAAIDRDLWDVVPIGITPTGRWVLAGDDPKRWQIEAGVLPRVEEDEGPAVPVPLQAAGELSVLEAGEIPHALGSVDVVFPLLHGPFGEDGTIQGLLELADVRYVGSGVLASAASMDKHYMKVLLEGAGLPVGPYTVIRGADWPRHRERVHLDVEELRYPVFVKPARAGSSIGISKVKSAEELDAAIESARLHDPKVIVEAMITGREIECAVLESVDGGPAATSLPGEIEVGGRHEFYDFEAKYLDEASVRLTCPADLPDVVARTVRDLAARSFEAMGCEGLARVDFFVRPDRKVIVNEINTMPGFTPFSMYPRMWEQTGLSYAELVNRLLTLALRRKTGLR